MANFVDQEQKEFERFYQTSLLWIKLRPISKRLGLLLFFLIDTALLLVFAWSFLDYGVFDFFTDRLALSEIILHSTDLRAVSEERAAQGITEHETGTFALTDNRADFYSVVSNPNPDWFVRFTYHFLYSGGQTEPVTGFLLPGEQQKTLVQLGVPVATAPRTAQIVLEDVHWSRVDAHTISDYAAFAAQRLDFSFDEVDYRRDVDLNGTKIARSSFVLTNNSAYGYWEPMLTIVLRRNTSIVGVTTTSVPRLEPGETRTVILNWFGTSPSANSTEVEVSIDLFDSSVFMSPSGAAAVDVRERLFVK